jgi:N-acyl-L-homoserine lactone synthetase
MLCQNIHHKADMSIKIKLAETASEIDEALKLRHKVFVEHDGRYSPEPDRRLYDRFDCCGTSVLVIAITADQVVGTARLNRDDPTMGFPADEYFDFRSFSPKNDATASLSQLAIDPEVRGNLKILNGMMMLTYYWAHRNNISHCVAPFNPALTRVMQRIGFEKIGDVVQSHHHDLAIQPMRINMLEVRKSFIEFVERQAFVGFMEPFFREYFDDGEVVVNEGEPGDCAYFIVDGTANVEVSSNSNGAKKVVATLGKGDLFGELSLILDQKRSASVVASNNLEVMILSRRQFINCIQSDSKNAMYTLQILASRLAATTSSMDSAES